MWYSWLKWYMQIGDRLHQSLHSFSLVLARFGNKHQNINFIIIYIVCHTSPGMILLAHRLYFYNLIRSINMYIWPTWCSWVILCSLGAITFGIPVVPRVSPYPWVSARKKYLQCISNGVVFLALTHQCGAIGIYQVICPTHYWACDYFSMLGFKLIHVSKGGLSGTKPILEPVLTYCQSDPWEQIQVKFQ